MPDTTTSDSILLAQAMTDVMIRLGGLPTRPIDAAPEEAARHETAFANALDALVEDLIGAYGAQVTIGEPIKVTILGITASSSKGVEDALRSWLFAATRRQIRVVR